MQSKAKSNSKVHYFLSYKNEYQVATGIIMFLCGANHTGHLVAIRISRRQRSSVDLNMVE